MEQWSNVGHSCVITLLTFPILCFLLSRLDNCLIMTLSQFFIVALMGMFQQARGQVLGFGGKKYIFRGEIFCFYYKF